MIALAILLLAAATGEDVRENPPAPPAAPHIELPRALETPAPEYPPDRLQRGETADVGLLITIDENGTVPQADVVESAGADFDAAALRAVRSYRFSPALRDGQPIPVRVHYVIHFVIEQRRAVAPPPQKSGSVSGEVLEAGSRKPLGGAEVIDVETGTSASADGDGRYVLAGVPGGERRLAFAAAGFDRRELTVAVTAGEIARAPRVYLHRTVVEGLHATVEGEKAREAPTRRSLSHDELVNMPGALNDPIRAIQNLPGLARAPFLGGALLVRGSPPADTGIYLDGHRIPLLFHFLGGPSVINEQLVDRIDFYPGGYGAYYGRSLVGAVDVGSARGAQDALHGDVSLDLIEAVGFVTAPLGKTTSVAIAARRSHVDLFLPLFIPNDPNRGVTTIVPIYWDYQARADHKLANGDDLTLFFFGSDDKLTVVQRGGRRALPLSVDSHIGFHRAVVQYRHDVSDAVSLRLSPALGWTQQSFSSEGAGTGAFASQQSAALTVLTGELRAEARLRARSWAELRVGIDLELDRAAYSVDIVTSRDLRDLGIPVAERRTFDRLQIASLAGEYAEADLRLGRLQLVPGVRFEAVHWKGNTSVAVDPRLWARYALTDTTALKAYAGLYHQPPTGQQIDPDLGNPGLGLARSYQVGAGAEHRVTQDTTVSAEVFYNRREALVTRADATRLPDGTLVNPRFLNQGIGRCFGIELLARRELSTRLYGWLAYTLSKSEVIAVPGDRWDAFTFDQRHILTLVVGYRPSPPWTLSTRFRLVSGNPRAPLLGATFDADSGRFVPDLGTIGDARNPTFAQLDVRAKRSWTFDTWELSVYLDVQNVTNRRNQELHVYDYRYRDEGGIAGLPILPTFGAKARF